jgi:hypothetical protein
MAGKVRLVSRYSNTTLLSEGVSNAKFVRLLLSAAILAFFAFLVFFVDSSVILSQGPAFLLVVVLPVGVSLTAIKWILRNESKPDMTGSTRGIVKNIVLESAGLFILLVVMLGFFTLKLLGVLP